MKAARKITVLVRYEIKQDCPEKGLHKGDVVLYVENDKGKRYYTTLRRNKAHSCSCMAGMHGRNCYHVVDLAAIENARFAAARAAKKVVQIPVKAARAIELAPLNGNKGFQLMAS